MQDIRIETSHISLKKYQDTIKELKVFLKHCHGGIDLEEVDRIIEENKMYGQSTIFNIIMRRLVETVLEETGANSNYKIEFGSYNKVYLTYVVIGN